MPANELPAMTVVDDPSAESLPTAHVWRQVACVNIAWAALLVSLLAVPSIRVFAIVAFLAVLVVVGISWPHAGHAQSDESTAGEHDRSSRAPLMR